MNKYVEGLDVGAANFQPLTPLNFISRSAQVYPDRTAIVHGERTITYTEFYQNACRLASGLSKIGIKTGDTVAVMAANIPAFLDASFAVPMTGAVLNSLNVRLDAQTLAYILDHGECDALLTDTAFAAVVKEALNLSTRSPRVVDIDDPEAPGGERLGDVEYEELLGQGDPNFAWRQPEDEWESLALNYTSGTTGNPKGVVYSHRGAYLNSLGNLLIWPMTEKPVYLWTLPMFHCNGWCFPWSITAVGGTHVCLRKVEAEAIVSSVVRNNVSHFCGAPVVLNTILNAPKDVLKRLPTGVKVLTAGAPPPASVIKGCEALGMEVTQVYGLTEVYGPCVVSEWNEHWDDRSAAERAALKTRQGVRYVTQEGLNVMDPETMEPVPCDGETVGEIMFQGNTTMKGYLKDRQATDDAFAGGWFHSGDLAVKHPDGYVEIRDRAKDIIISGGENISSVEVEGVLYEHPAVLEAAVVAQPDEKWGEKPCAFVTLKEGRSATEQDIIGFCRDNMAHFKIPGTVVFGELPKTSTGKVQKFVLRERARNM